MNAARFSIPLLQQVVPFLEEIGITVRAGVVPPGEFLPGVRIGDGGLTVDEATLTWPSDVLHEAGHIAVLLPHERQAAQARMRDDPALEMAALAWSYAVARRLGVPSRVLFHDGYKAGGEALAAAFDGGTGPGVPMLAWLGMTQEPHVAARLGQPGFPVMIHWLRQEPPAAPAAGQTGNT